MSANSATSDAAIIEEFDPIHRPDRFLHPMPPKPTQRLARDASRDVGQNVEAHLGSDLVEGLGREVGARRPRALDPDEIAGLYSKLPADHRSRGDLVLVAGWARCADSVGFAALAA